MALLEQPLLEWRGNFLFDLSPNWFLWSPISYEIKIYSLLDLAPTMETRAGAPASQNLC